MSYASRLRQEEKEESPTERRAFARLIGLRLKLSRQALGLDGQAMAKKLGLSQSGYSRLETGRTEITVWQLVQLAAALKCPLLGLIPPR